MAVALMKIGIPFDIAWDMVEGGVSEGEVMAYLVAGGELEGGTFDWNRWEWDKG